LSRRRQQIANLQIHAGRSSSRPSGGSGSCNQQRIRTFANEGPNRDGEGHHLRIRSLSPACNKVVRFTDGPTTQSRLYSSFVSGWTNFSTTKGPRLSTWVPTESNPDNSSSPS
jgi:hypothetical protein